MFERQKKIYQIDLERYFLDAEIPGGRKTFVVYQLCTGKAADLVGHLESISAATWNEMRILLDRCYAETVV